MKSEPYNLVSEKVLNNLITRLKELPLDGKYKAVISDAGSKSGRQRALNWLWNSQVAESGRGGRHEDTKEGVHLVAKYRWARPILIRDDPLFADLWSIWYQLYAGDEERLMWFVDKQISTENMTVSQVAEFLTSYQRYYTKHGINLTNPDDKGLLDYMEGMK